MNCPKCNGSNIKVIGDSIYCLDCGLFNPPAEVRLECPYCGQPVETTTENAAQGIACPSCNQTFGPIQGEPVSSPVKRTPITRPRAAPNAQQRDTANQLFEESVARLKSPREQNNTSKRPNSIRAQANFFAFAAICSCVVAVLTLFSDLSWGVAASLFGAGLWFYLIAQIIHIRANTEK